MREDLQVYLSLINFFFLAVALLVVYYYAYRLKAELKRSEKLRNTAERYRALFNATTEGVFQCDKEGHFLIINKAGARILGFEDPEEMVRKKIKASRFFADSKSRERLTEQLAIHGNVENFVVKTELNNGNIVFLEATINVRSTEGGYEGIFRDVTQRIALQEELRNYSRNLEMRVQEKTREVLSLEREKFHLEKLAAVGEMAATIVHEVRNPLSSVKVGLTTLLNRTELEEQDHHCLEVAVREVVHLEKILKDLLNFAKPEELRFVVQDVNQVLNFAVDQLAEDFDRIGISVSKEFCPNLPRIRLDMDRLSQVFFNILLNAKQAMVNGGTVSVRSEGFPERRMVRIEIADEGQGIRKKDLNHIFEPFFSTKSGGTGLGLAVVQTIVEAHGGTVEIESHWGKGTKICVELPANWDEGKV